jgi:hypothetical protein
MKIISQTTLSSIAAGAAKVSSQHPDNSQSQPKAVTFTELAWLVFSAAVTWFVNNLLEEGYKNRKEREEKEKNDRDRRRE